MSLKITPSLSLELAEDIKDNTFLLLGHENLESTVPRIGLLKDALFSEHYDSGDHLLYQASLVYKGHDHLQEVGLGIFKRKGNKCYIQRENALYYIDESKNIIPSDRLLNFPCDPHNDEQLILSCYTPKTIQEVLYLPNTIVTCETPHLPTSVELDKNSLLGRLNDNIESIDIASIFTPNNVLKVVTQCTRMLKFMCSMIDVKKLRTPHIEFKPVKSPKAKEGSCYYDKDDKALKYYNGTEWVTLQ